MELRIRVLLRLAALVLATSLSSHLIAQVIYVSNPGESTISTFIINTETGTLTEVLPRALAAGAPMATVTTPNAKFLYVADAGTNNVNGFTLNQSTGLPTPFAASPTYPLTGFPPAIAVDPNGKFVYAVVQPGSNVIGYSINASTGALTRTPNTPYTTGNGPSAVAIDGTGKFVYVTNQGSNNVSAYTIDSSTGALTPVPGSPFLAGFGPMSAATDRAGKFVYVANYGGNTISVYAINSATGSLTAVPSSPFTDTGGPASVAVDLAGKFLYVANANDNTVSAFTINSATGALTAVSGSPFAAQRSPNSVVLDPSGKFVYVANTSSNTISQFAVNSTTGALTSLGAVASGSAPRGMSAVQFTPAIPPPVIAQATLNAASYALPQLPNYGIAQGSMFLIFGQNMGPATLQQASSFPLTTQLAGTSVQVAVGSVVKNAILVYTYASLVAAILPSSTPVGDGILTVTYNNRVSTTAPIHVVASSLGILTRNMAGSGPAIVQNYNSAADQPVNSVIESAHPGQTMILWGTGLGPVTFDETVPPQVQNVRNDVEVWVGMKRLTPFYSGRSPQYPGLDQINFTLPSDVALGCYVPLAVKAGGVVSNYTSIAVAAQGKVCSDAHGLASGDVASLQTGSLNIGWIQLVRENMTATIAGLGSGSGLMDHGWADWFRWNGVTGSADVGLDLLMGRGTALGTCSVATFRNPGSTWVVPRAAFLNAGSTLNVTTSKGKGTLTAKPFGDYEAVKALGYVVPAGVMGPAVNSPFFEPGSVTIDNGSGGPDVGKFNTTLTIPASPTPLSWTNFDAIAGSPISRSADLTVTWAGGDSSEYVMIGVGSFLPNVLSKAWVGAGVFCAEKASAGQLTIPSVALSALPASTSGDSTSGVMMMGRAPLLTNNMKFTATGLDFGYATFAQISVKPVIIQ